MNEIITIGDLEFVNDLSSRTYTGNAMSSSSTEEERKQFKDLRVKLKKIASYFKGLYNETYGEFSVNMSTGNPIAISSTSLNRLWSTFHKGSNNKQYSGQISFVMNQNNKCLDVGFYFGRAQAHMKEQEEKIELENRLKFLGQELANKLNANHENLDQFDTLFDYGFKAYKNNREISGADWLNVISTDPKNSQIIYHLYPNKHGLIEPSTLNVYVSMILFMMTLLPSYGQNVSASLPRTLTPEERAKQAERRALIGLSGEEFVLELEKSKVRDLGFDPEIKVDHVSLKSDSYGYDILSCDENGEEIFIEVKTTTRIKNDVKSREFYISSKEKSFYEDNLLRYELHRVYDIEGDNPKCEKIDMSNVDFVSNNYKAIIL